MLYGCLRNRGEKEPRVFKLSRVRRVDRAVTVGVRREVHRFSRLRAVKHTGGDQVHFRRSGRRRRRRRCRPHIDGVGGGYTASSCR